MDGAGRRRVDGISYHYKVTVDTKIHVCLECTILQVVIKPNDLEVGNNDFRIL